MGFLTPAFFAGLVALGLPVWLHLLQQHRTTPVPFASLMFFERRLQSSVKHRRLKYLLLFALRMLLLALIVLAFTHPYLERRESAGVAGKAVKIIAIDRSFSMRQGGRLDRAKQQALEAARGFASGDRVEVISFGAGVRVEQNPVTDPAAVRAAIQGVRASDERSSFAELARALRAAAQTLKVPVEAHVFSDMQKSSWPPNFADAQLGGGVRLIPYPVVEAREANFAVESVLAPARLYDPKKVRVQVTVAGYGTGPARRRVTLAAGGREIESKEIDLPANGRASVEFFALEASYGWNRAEARLSPGDAFPDDDVLYFAVERTEPRKVLFVSEGRGSRAQLYFRTALESASDAAFSMDAMTAAQAAGLPLKPYACVVLSDVGGVPAGLEENLRQYVEAGGALWVVLGRAALARDLVPVSGEKVRESRYSSREGERFRTVAALDAAHPAVRSAPRWEGVKFFQAVAVDPDGARVVARLSDEAPLLLERPVGEGRVLVFASPLDNIANDFPLHPSFVPFVVETARYLARMEESRSSQQVGAYYELRAAAGAGTAVEVLDPRGQRALSLTEAAEARGITLAERGYYEIRRPSGFQELVAVNPDRSESDLEVLPAETLALWRNTGQDAAGAAAGGAAQTRRVSLWWYVLLAAFLLSLAEAWVGNRHLAVQEQQSKASSKGGRDESV
jgi:hypothetical protein